MELMSLQKKMIDVKLSGLLLIAIVFVQLPQGMNFLFDFADIYIRAKAMSGQKKLIDVKLSGLLLIVIVFVQLPQAAPDVIFENQCKVPISVCRNDADHLITLQPGGSARITLKTNESVSFWACNVHDKECINTQNPTATVALIGADNSYRLSAQQGYNFAVRITCVGCGDIVTCKANLDDCPSTLSIRNPNSGGAVVACKCPETDSQLYDTYSSLFDNSGCPMPCTPDDPSCTPDSSKTCPASRDLQVSFIEG